MERLTYYRNQQTRQRFDVLKQSESGLKSQEDRIALPTGEGLEFIFVHQIARIESSSNYSRIFFNDGKTLLVTRMLKDFESLLRP